MSLVIRAKAAFTERFAEIAGILMLVLGMCLATVVILNAIGVTQLPWLLVLAPFWVPAVFGASIAFIASAGLLIAWIAS